MRWSYGIVWQYVKALVYVGQFNEAKMADVWRRYEALQNRLATSPGTTGKIMGLGVSCSLT